MEIMKSLSTAFTKRNDNLIFDSMCRNKNENHRMKIFILNYIQGVIILLILAGVNHYAVAQSTDKNYVQVYAPQVKIKDEPTFQNLASDETKVSSQIHYADGLGRPLQTVNYKASPNGKDMVQPVVYDNFGRETIKYEPYTSGEGNGNYKDDPTGQKNGYAGSAHYSFYNSVNDKVENDDKPYAVTVYEKSPLSRVLKQGAPGVSWQPDGNAMSLNDNTVKYRYEFNTASEVLLWSYNEVTHCVNAKKTDNTLEYFAINTLTVQKTYNEDKKLSITYADREGRTLLKRVQAGTAETPVNDQNYASTYYIYDDFNNLRVVLPPEAVARLSTEYHTVLDVDQEGFLKRWAYRYKFDNRQRMTEKQVPGAAPVYMVYDKRDRLVLTQDGEQRKKIPKREWTFTKYDAFNNPVLTGIYQDNGSHNQGTMQAEVDNFYGGNAGNKLYEERLPSGQTGLHGYTNRSFPTSVVENDFLTVSYYNDYGAISGIGVFEYMPLLSNGAYNPYVRGMITVVKNKVLGQNQWLYSANYYDATHRLIQNITQHISGTNRITNEYDFTGKIVRTQTRHFSKDYNIIYTDRNVYDAAGRIKATYNKFESFSSRKTNKTPIEWYQGNWPNYIDLSNSNMLTKRGGGDGWNTIISGVLFPSYEGATGFTITQTNVKLKYGVAGASYGEMDCGWYVNGDRLEIEKNGESIANLGSYSIGDELTVEYGSEVYFKKNGQLVFTTPLDFEYWDGLYPAGAIYTPGASIVNSAIIFEEFETLPGMNQEVQIASYDYNELGQLVTKKLHSTNNGSTFKQHVDFRYNIRGWLNRINNADLNTSDGGPKDYFGLEFGYNNSLGIGEFTPQYNGNISATKWSANLGLALSYINEPTERAYKFTYDPMNRLREANYASKVGSWSSSLAYKEAMDYDLNGNILSLYRNNGKSAPMDWLKFNYGDGTNRSNQLKSVTDYGILTKGFRDGNTSGDDYTYDGNGNLVQDKNKGIGEIKYNSLNVTEQIDKSTGEKIKYIYDADGIKLAEEIYSAGAQTPVKRIDYVGPLVYENDTLKFIVHEEGKVIIPKGSSEGPEYQYQIKDHLGNVRLTFTAKEKKEVFKATMEDTGIPDYNNPRVQEMAHFGNLFETEIRNVSQWLNHTSSAIGNAIYLDGSQARTIGPHSMLKVYPGDTVKMEVFAKFEKKSNHNATSLAMVLASLVTPLQAATIVVDGGAGVAASKLIDGIMPFLSAKENNSTVPGAYINYILFDKNFNVVDLGFDRIHESAGFNPGQENTVLFDKLQLQRIIDRVGYIYVYVSNESEGTRVWMDDIKITYGHSPIVQFEDYYPFGLSQSETAFQRGNDKYTGMATTEGTGLKDLGFRQYDAALGRFHAVDPLAELQDDQSAYQYAGNNPVNQIDVLGLEAEYHDKDKNKPKLPKRDRHKKEQRTKEKDGHSRYKPGRRNDHQRGSNSQSARNRRQKSNNTETSSRKKKDGSGKNASTSKRSGNTNELSSSDLDLVEQELINMSFSGPQMKNEREKSERRNSSTDVFNNQNNNNRQPRFENSVTPPRIEDDIEAGTPSVVQSSALGETVTDIGQYREYLYRNHSNNEARALYARMLISRNYNYQSSRLKDNVAAVAITSTSDDVIDPVQKEKIECPTCPPGWEDLIAYKPPLSVYKKLSDKNEEISSNSWFPDWEEYYYMHEIEDAMGRKINLDKYTLQITKLPIVNGKQLTIEDLFNYFRLNMDMLIDDDVAKFGDLRDNEFGEGERWDDQDYNGVIKVFRGYLHRTPIFDDLAVVSSAQTDNSFIFSPLRTPETLNHAVSGNRQFGFIKNSDGTFSIYTRAADVATAEIDISAGELVFKGGDALWRNLFNNLATFIQQNGGITAGLDVFSQRFNINKK
jgi:RHS repeat-associated protein